jgi:hypothetical protein
MSEISKLRMELKADLELMEIRTNDLASSFEVHADNVEAQFKEVNQKLEEITTKLKSISTETTRLGREVAEGQRWMAGRYRHMQGRFDAVLSVMENEHSQDRELLFDLRDRVERLEQDRPPAA